VAWRERSVVPAPELARTVPRVRQYKVCSLPSPFCRLFLLAQHFAQQRGILRCGSLSSLGCRHSRRIVGAGYGAGYALVMDNLVTPEGGVNFAPAAAPRPPRARRSPRRRRLPGRGSQAFQICRL
jgi:hypothetical protein